MWDFLTFRKMLTPIVIQVLFWLGVVACILGGIGAILTGFARIDRVPELIGIGILAVVFGPLVVRIYCEWLIVLFRINDTLTEIRRNTDRGK
jgi:hypothetical protein